MGSHANRSPEDELASDVDEPQPLPKQRRRGFNHGNTRPVILPPSRTHDDYNVCWICALPIEMAAAKGMLDETHAMLPNSPRDSNTYILGSIGPHNIVIATLPSGHYGTNNAATVANNMTRTYPSVRIRLMVGIGGGAPLGKADIRLGDVVVSDKILQHDFGKITARGALERTGAISRPPQDLLTAVAKLRAEHELAPSQVPTLIDQMVGKHPAMSRYSRHDSLEDHLYDSEYDHSSSLDYCGNCDQSRLIARQPRPDNQPRIHYGTVASGNQVLKHGRTRDQLARELGVLCFEMEAAGLIDSFPCLVIRGISDYCDSHKNDTWRAHAAAVAAAYAKELLCILPSSVDSSSTNAVEEIDIDSAELPKHLKRQHILWKGLAFHNIDGQQSTVKRHNSNTCKWILSHEDYLNWLDQARAIDHLGFFWIRGKPGAGKSTLMNFLFQESQKEESCITIAFFFNARGSSLEQSAPGMYRSVLYQLLEAAPELLNIFNSRIHKLELERIHDAVASESKDVGWPPELLQSLLFKAIALLRNRRLTIFIDALDECQEEEMGDMVEFFQDLCDNALRSGLELRICLSSRHYPHIEIERGQKLTLELQSGHEADIYTYVRSKLKMGKSKLAQDIEKRITEKASGIFTWVVLVVQILNNEYKDGRIHQVRKRLDAIPSKLSDVFRDILKKDNRNMDDFRLCIMWIIFAKRPLTLKEFYFAAISGLSPEFLDAWDPDEVLLDDMARYVLSSSRGLAEVAASSSMVVQLIHETVREFFLGDGMHELWPDVPRNQFELISHARLAECCFDYIALDLPGCQSHSQHDSDPHFRDCPVLVTYPFLTYATAFGFWHAEQSRNKRYQAAVLKSLSLHDWIRKNNLAVSRDRAYSDGVSLLYILADRGLPALILLLLDRDRRIDIYGGQYGYPLFAALAHGDLESVHALLYHGQIPGSNNELLETMKHGLPSHTEGQTPLAWAAACGLEKTLNVLQSINGANLGTGRDGRTPLSWAAGNGHLRIAEKLMSMEDHLNKVDDQGRTPLGWAAMNRQDAIVSMLLAHPSIDANLGDIRSRTPLSLATIFGHSSTVRLLLSSRSIKVDVADDGGRTPLWWAAHNGHASIVKMLLATNAVDVNARDSSGRTSLLWSAINGHQSTVEVLLTSKEVDPDARDSRGQTALLWAVANGYDGIAQLLLATKKVSPKLEGLDSASSERSKSMMRPRAIMDIIRKQDSSQ